MNDPVGEALEQVISYYTSKTEGARAAFEWQALGTYRPNALQNLLWWAQVEGAIPAAPGFKGPGPNGEVYPPEMFTSPEGIPVQGSAYRLALPYWQGGKEELARWARDVQRAREGALS